LFFDPVPDQEDFMKTSPKPMLRRGIVFMVVLVAMLILTTGVLANTRTDGGGDLPYYARIERGEILHTNKWAAIIFYRPTECVPSDFNLLDFYDFGAFGCSPPTTDGFIIWSGEPWISAPVLINLKGLGAVPVWFVRWSELQALVEDDSLTMAELEAVPSLLVGEASLYKETLLPATGEPDVMKPPMINYVARGTLEDGRTFYVHALMVVDTITNVEITFK
jgi:hypothetical protein